MLAPLIAALVVTGPLPGQAAASVGLRVYFVRHAETVANLTGRYNADTVDRFSERGERQVADFTERLGHLRFDAICVSPMPRAIRTVAPYLQRVGRQAVIWPELAECAYQKDRDAPPSRELSRGLVVRAPVSVSELFRVPAESNRSFECANYADGVAQIQLLVERLRQEFGGSGRTVLLVGHSIAGSRFFEMLLGLEPRGRFAVANAEISCLEQTANGSFRLVQLNGKLQPRTAVAQ